MGGTRQTSIVGQALNDTTMKKNHLDSMDGDASMDPGSNKPEDPNYNDMPPEFIPVGDQAVCKVCKDPDGDERMLLCDICDSGYHFDCLTPKLKGIPDGDWVCAECSRNPPHWAKFQVGDQCVLEYSADIRWVGKIIKIDGGTARMHFNGWHKRHDLDIPRNLLRDLPPQEVLDRAVRSRLLTPKEEEERVARSKREEDAQAERALAEEIEGKIVGLREELAGVSRGASGSDEEQEAKARIAALNANVLELRRQLPMWHKQSLKPKKDKGPAAQRVERASKKEASNRARFSERVATLAATGCDDGWSDCCVECGAGGELLCCDTCPRSYCLDCVRMDRFPKGRWCCKPCANATRMVATGGGVGSGPLLLQIQRLCEQFPMTHFLGALSVDLARVRALAQAARDEGISLNGMHQVSTPEEAAQKLNAMLLDLQARREGNVCPDGGVPAALGVSGAASYAAQVAGGARGAGEHRSAEAAEAAVAAPAVPGLLPRYQKYEEVVTRFYQEGLCRPGISLTPGQVEMCRDAVTSYYNRVRYTIQTLQLHDELEGKGWSEFKLRCPGRYDMQVPALDSPDFDFLRGDAPWMEAVRAILGEECRLTVMGCMLSQPGSQTQQWHSDGDHLSEHEHLPPYAVNVFVPLVDVDASLGPTEFVPTTHLLFNYDPALPVPSVTIPTPAGECLLFDYRVKHRGLGNRGTHARPMMYITYGTKAWADRDNFSRKRYAKLPPLLEQRPPRSALPADREERLRVLRTMEAGTDAAPRAGKRAEPAATRGTAAGREAGAPGPARKNGNAGKRGAFAASPNGKGQAGKRGRGATAREATAAEADATVGGKKTRRK